MERRPSTVRPAKSDRSAEGIWLLSRITLVASLGMSGMEVRVPVVPQLKVPKSIRQAGAVAQLAGKAEMDMKNYTR